MKRSLPYLFRSGVDSILERLQGSLGRMLIYVYKPFCNIEIGRGVKIFGLPIIRSPRGAIVLGKEVQLISSAWRASAAGIGHRVRLRTFSATARIIFEEGAGINGGSVTARSKEIRVGKRALIGPDCVITDSDFHIPWPAEKRWEYTTDERDADVRIGNYVWIGARCIILRGVTIGDNAIIGAGSVVTSDVPANALAAGNPAVVKKIFEQVCE